MEDILDDWEKEKSVKLCWLDYIGISIVIIPAMLIWFIFCAWWDKSDSKNTNP